MCSIQLFNIQILDKQLFKPKRIQGSWTLELFLWHDDNLKIYLLNVHTHLFGETFCFCSDLCPFDRLPSHINPLNLPLIPGYSLVSPLPLALPTQRTQLPWSVQRILHHAVHVPLSGSFHWFGLGIVKNPLQHRLGRDWHHWVQCRCQYISWGVADCSRAVPTVDEVLFQTYWERSGSQKRGGKEGTVGYIELCDAWTT